MEEDRYVSRGLHYWLIDAPFSRFVFLSVGFCCQDFFKPKQPASKQDSKYLPPSYYLSNQVKTAADLLSDSFVAVNLQLFQSFNESPVRIVPSHNRSQYLGIQAGSPLFPTDWHTFVGFVQFNPIRWWFSALNCRHSKYSSWNYWLNFLLGFVSTSWTVIGFIKNIDHR